MHYHFHRRVAYCCLIVAIGITFFMLQRPSQSTESAVVFSNMPAADQGGRFFNPGNDLTVIFDVPLGPDYQVNSLQTRFANSLAATTISASIHVDDGTGTFPGAVVVDLGSQNVPSGLSTITFSPTGPTTLPNGGRYWLVLSNPDLGITSVVWTSANPGIAPTGVFSFVDNGIINAGTYYPAESFWRYNLTLDADPITVASGNGGACVNTDGRLNAICAEPYQTAAMYCRPDGSIDVYGITDGVGWLAFRTTPAEIDAVGIPAQNTMIEDSADGKIRLYRLATGEFQINAPMWDDVRGNLPDGYVFTWDACS